MGRRLAMLVLGLLFTFACRKEGNKLDRARDAHIAFEGDTPTLIVGEHRVAVLPKEVETQGVVVWRDETGDRLAYGIANGQFRLVYRLAQRWFVGPAGTAPISFKDAPPVDDVLPTLYEHSTGAEIADAVAESRGAEALAKLLVAVATTCDDRWRANRERIISMGEETLHVGLEMRFDRGDPVAECTAREVSSEILSHRKGIHEQTRKAMMGHDRTAAVLLRTLLQVDPHSAAEIACKGLDAFSIQALTKDHAFYIEAIGLALAASDAPCNSFKGLAEQLTPMEATRCNADGTIVGATTNLDEPLCTREQMSGIIKAEVREPPREMFLRTSARPALTAYGALVTRMLLPPDIFQAHTRRRYAIKQPAAPDCRWELAAPGTPCQCPEYVLRKGALESKMKRTVEADECTFDIDDMTQTIRNVRKPRPSTL